MNVDDALREHVFDAVSLPLSVIDVHGRQVACNGAYAEFLGYRPDEVGGIDVGRITRAEDALWTRTYLMRLASGELDEFTTDKVYVRRDGTEVVGRLSARPIRGADGAVEYLVAAISPVADEPRAADTQVRRLLEYTNDTLTIIDVDGNVIESKGRQSPILGYPTVFWTHRNIRDLVPDDDWHRLVELRTQVLAEPGRAVEAEVEVRAGDGSPQTLQIRLVNCLDDPAIGGLVLVTRNVTEFRRTVAELSEQRETAEAVLDAQTRLLATVSHELRNPLHAVRGIAELLAAEELPPTAAELASSLTRQLSGLAHVTQDLLDTARLDAGTVTLEPAPVELPALVDDVISLGRAMAGDRPVVVSSRLMHGVPPWVVADAARLRQVLGNLVGNAVKFTAEGSVQLVVRSDDGDRVTFSVIDTGTGIPPDEQAAVLEPFRVGSTAGEQRGAGLGLSIVQRIVGAMDGRLTLASTVGEGSRFDVHLRLPTAASPDAAQPDGLRPGLTVLVVEDNPVNQQLANSQLERLGLDAVIVGSGEAGLDVLTGPAAVDIDVVLMDQQLPGIDGTETTRRIRQLSGRSGALPVIGLSASASSADREAFVVAGMTDFIPKPASLNDLSDAIGRAVGPGDAAAPTGQDDASASVEPPVTDDDIAGSVDESVLARLGDELGGDEIVAELVATFLSELGPRVGAIAGGLAEDEQAARRAAHTLKSSARLLGANPLADACATIELDEDRDVDIAAAADRARSAFERWLSARE